jgi:hypothetical protein
MTSPGRDLATAQRAYALLSGVSRSRTGLVSDHFLGEGGLANDRLYMTVLEQRQALLNAGFSEVREMAVAGTRASNARLQPQPVTGIAR